MARDSRGNPGLIGKVWEETNVSPSSVEISFITKKCRFFLQDRWLEIGPVRLRTPRAAVAEVDLPDVAAWVRGREFLKDGTERWLEWGPRIN